MHFELCSPHVLPAFASSPQVAAILACICMSPLALPASMQQCARGNASSALLYMLIWRLCHKLDAMFMGKGLHGV